MDIIKRNPVLREGAVFFHNVKDFVNDISLL